MSFLFPLEAHSQYSINILINDVTVQSGSKWVPVNGDDDDSAEETSDIDDTKEHTDKDTTLTFDKEAPKDKDTTLKFK